MSKMSKSAKQFVANYVHVAPEPFGKWDLENAYLAGYRMALEEEQVDLEDVVERERGLITAADWIEQESGKK